ncbi:MAG TPA: hypothetical protein VLF40_05125 [Candidatus Saccharimonadales bacterium]|nr:hypothetical protein [Candidatus Saccharimonadales bacterium]
MIMHSVSYETFDDQPAPEPLAATPYAETSAFITEQGRFHSEKDRSIALSIAGRLEERSRYGRLSDGEYLAAAASLRALVPTDNGRGGRQIDGKTIVPAMEERIRSRLASPEIDIAAPDGSWGRLPKIVKNYITRGGSDISMELTANCTVGCSFCALANKGPISAKASFDSALAVMQYFISNQPPDPTGRQLDYLYYGTDPFDAKWVADASNPEDRDYSDLAAAYRRIAGPARSLGTTTAVPLGEELRVLDFMDRVLTGRDLYGQHCEWARISTTDVNASRVEHIRTLLRALHPITHSDILANDVRNNVAARGSALSSTTKTFNLWDITGPDCYDGVLIGVHSADSLIMQGASHERPNGSLRTPVETKQGSVTRYAVPRHQKKPFFDGNSRVGGIYPDVAVDVFEVDEEGVMSQHSEHMSQDPHRALLRLAGLQIHRNALEAQGRRLESRIVIPMFTPDILRMRAYLRSGGNNGMMRAILNAAIPDRAPLTFNDLVPE